MSHRQKQQQVGSAERKVRGGDGFGWWVTPGGESGLSVNNLESRGRESVFCSLD